MIDGGVHLNWDNFKRVFLEKYFLDDVRSQKEVEFLELKQGNDIVAEYAAKFDVLVCYCTHYHGEGGERVKCIKFVNGLHPEVKTAINYQEIYHFSTLVNESSIYDHDNHASAAFYKGAGGPMRFFQGNQVATSGSKSHVARSKPYAGRSVVSGIGSVGGFVSTPTNRCKKCGRRGHTSYECLDKDVTCFNCRGKGHISTQCPEAPRPRATGSDVQAECPKATGRVFSLSGAEAAQFENLIQVDRLTKFACFTLIDIDIP
ncbi:uncharacterized protein LOC109806915 [Cajanus cajan]|uniref:uncharacterized protein LOC109806915 n=1 Tax=Cajanus cajan TaxID=3821 RepID=UPI00098DCAFA|nr:uncharacterized protein LOC109806915 [Cajanus cajan]